MRIAFYAPLNPPDSPVPSGDRQIARTILRTLRAAGHEVAVASRYRALDLEGDPDRVRRLEQVGRKLAERSAARFAAMHRDLQPHLWLTYHLYHKAPDWFGPVVADRLGIPYAIVEASHAEKQRNGPWSSGLSQVEAALGRADLVIGNKTADERAVRPRLRPDARYVYAAPFLDCSPFARARDDRELHRRAIAARTGLDPAQPWLLTVGMMRPGPKRRCYETLAAALQTISAERWQLLIAGQGPEEAAVRAAIGAAIPGERVRWLGCVQGPDLAALYAAADLFVWPAVKEPLGMVFIEAQAAGLPVVGGERRGVTEIVLSGDTALLTPEGDAAALGDAVRELLRDPARRTRLGERGALHAQQRHDLTTAGRAFVELVEELTSPAAGTCD